MQWTPIDGQPKHRRRRKETSRTWPLITQSSLLKPIKRMTGLTTKPNPVLRNQQMTQQSLSGEVSESELGTQFNGRRDFEGRLLPTSSHLFKLVLPLPGLRPISKSSSAPTKPEPVPPTVFLLHPSQPLSHIARLIQASLPSPTHGPQAFTPKLPTVSFQHEELDKGKQQWSDSTDIGDFVKEAAHSKEFTILITPDQASNTAQLAPQQGSTGAVHDRNEPEAYAALQIPVSVPSFEDRTRYLRRRLERMDSELKGMQDIKDSCDALARRGTKRIATGVFVILLTYWLAVLRLTFFSTYGWETMEVSSIAAPLSRPHGSS